MLLTYMDDVTIAFSGIRASAVSRDLNISDWQLRLNVDKCVTMVFDGRSQMKYPGVVFECRVNFCRYVDYVLEKASKIHVGYHSLLRTRE